VTEKKKELEGSNATKTSERNLPAKICLLPPESSLLLSGPSPPCKSPPRRRLHLPEAKPPTVQVHIRVAAVG